jgi:hypothetical protein
MSYALRVLPNPVVGAWEIRFRLPEPGHVELTLVDLKGRVKFYRRFDALGRGDHGLHMKPSTSLAPGLYFLRLHHRNRIASQRVCIMRLSRVGRAPVPQRAGPGRAAHH